MVTSRTLVLPSKATQLAGFFGTSFHGNWFSIQEVMSFFKDNRVDSLL